MKKCDDNKKKGETLDVNVDAKKKRYFGLFFGRRRWTKRIAENDLERGRFQRDD